MHFSPDITKRIPYLVGGILLIFLIKPVILFKPNGKPRLYGIGYDDEGYKKTLYTIQFVIIALVVGMALLV
jgi:hypothetical protein